MRERGSSGIWELFVPGLSEGTIYKYEIKTKSDTLLQKTDPQGFYCRTAAQNGFHRLGYQQTSPGETANGERPRSQA